MNNIKGLTQTFSSPTKIKQVGDSYTPDQVINLPQKEELDIYAGLKGIPGAAGGVVVNVSSFPPDVIIKNATYYVGDIGGEKKVYTTDNNGNIFFQLGGKQYRFFNSNGDQIG